MRERRAMLPFMRWPLFACAIAVAGACLPTREVRQGDEAGLSDASLNGNDVAKLDVDLGFALRQRQVRVVEGKGVWRRPRGRCGHRGERAEEGGNNEFESRVH